MRGHLVPRLLVLLAFLCQEADGISFKKIYRAGNLKHFEKKISSNKLDTSPDFFGFGQEEESEPRLFDLEGSEFSTGSKDDNIPKSKVHNRNVMLEFTNTLPKTALVSASSALTSVLISSFLSMMLFSSVWLGLVKFVSLFFLASAWTKTDVGDFSRTLGVFLLLLLKQVSLISSIQNIFILVVAAMGIQQRRPFPPGPSVWKYQRSSPSDPKFHMYRTLVTLLLLGSYLGRVASFIIPVVPTWIDILFIGGGLTYLGTLSTTQGDLARYVGFSILTTISVMKDISRNVQLWDKFEVVWDKLSSLVSKANEDHSIMKNIKMIALFLFRRISGFFIRLKTEMNGHDTGGETNEFISREEEFLGDEEDFNFFG